MVKINKKKQNKIITILLEKYDFKEKLDSLLKIISHMNASDVYYADGEVVTHEELRRRTKRGIEILTFCKNKAKEKDIQNVYRNII